MHTMLFPNDDARERARTIGGLATANPFLDERVALERRLLGDTFVEGTGLWRYRSALGGAPSENAFRVNDLVWTTAQELRNRYDPTRPPSDEDQRLYLDVARYALYSRCEVALTELTIASEQATTKLRAGGYASFERDAAALLVETNILGIDELPHLYATLFQVRRAFHHVFTNVIGSSSVTARLRGDIWRSIFTYDLRRHHRAMYMRMSDTPTLILGPSGTGKELVARSIALSSYLPFDAETKSFPGPIDGRFVPVNVAALAPTLVESELFGHVRGAFTGASADRAGYLEVVPETGAVFLDEIGDLDASLQVKLLRLLQSRSFSRLGDAAERTFRGKILAATHRDLEARMLDDRFREDLYYRLCADIVETPSLTARLRDDPDELEDLLLFLSIRIAGVDEGTSLADEVYGYVTANIPADYPWPGNVRELEQCVRNVLIRRRYRPRRTAPATLGAEILQGRMSLEDMTRAYVNLVYERVGSFKGAAEVLGIDRRTVARWVR